MRTFVFVLLIFTIGAAMLFAQDSSEWYIGKPIKDIRFKGLQHVSENELEGVVKPYIGEEFSDELFLEIQSKLYALDYFEMFVPNAKPGDEDYNSIIIEFEVTERPVVEDIRVEGNSSIRKADILDEVLLKDGDMVSKTKVKLDSEAINDLYLERGFPDVKVEGNIVENEEENTADIVFTIEEGKQIRIKEIAFSGNEFASEGTLKRVLELKEQSLFRKGIFQDSKLEKDIQNIQMYYWEHGYIDAEVVDVVKEPVEEQEEEDKNYITLTFYIEEGEQYTYSGMEFEGNTLFSDEELREVVRLDPGDVLDKKELEADFARINDLYYDNGYIYNVITKEAERDEKANTVFYNISIVEKDRAHIEDIIIKGNEKTKDNVIYRELPIMVGDVFSKKLVMEGLQNLYNTGYFSTIEPTTPMGSVDGLVDLVLNVEEGKTVDINFGVTFSGAAGDFPVMGFLKLQDKNFLGRGYLASVGVEASGRKQSIKLEWNDKWFLGNRFTLGFNTSFSHELATSIKQDIMSPVFSEDDPNKVPDPYKGYYVFSEKTKYKDGNEYKAGELVPGSPSDKDIDEYDLITDYSYDLNQGISIPEQYLMDYHTFDISFGANAGPRWHTPIGRFSINLSPQVTLKHITYDDTINRPFSVTERNNLNKFRLINSMGLTLAWDTRDYIYNPSEGHYLSQSFDYTGGLLFGERHFIRSTSKGEAYITLFDIPVFDAWNFKMVLALSSKFSLILPQPYAVTRDGGKNNYFEATQQDLLYTEGMLIARGWPRIMGGMALWNNWFELRIPIAEQYIWWDFFFNMTGFWEERDDLAEMQIEDYMFSFGGGLRLTIPGLPMGFYLTKRFKKQDEGWRLQTGSLFNKDEKEGAGLDFVISFTYELF